MTIGAGSAIVGDASRGPNGDDPGDLRGTGPGGREITGLLTAMGCALTGYRLLVLAIPWLMLTRTGSLTQTGLITLADTSAYLVTQTLAGPVLDRVPARRVVTVCCGLSAAALLALAALPDLQLGVVAVLVAVVGAANGPAATAKQALMPALSATAGRRLEHGSSLMIAVERGASAGGPVLAGVLLSTAGGPATLGCAAGLYVMAVAAATGLPRTRPSEVPGTYRRRMADGVGHLVADATLRSLLIMFAVGNAVDEAVRVVLLPEWIRGHGLNAAFAGTLLGLFGAMAAVTAFATARVGHRFPRRTTYLAGALIGGTGRIVVLASNPSPAVVLIVFAVAGMTSGPFNAVVTAVQNERIPEQLRGRVLALIVTAAWLGIPTAGITGAWLTETAGTTRALWICAAVYSAAALYPTAHITDRPAQTTDRAMQDRPRHAAAVTARPPPAS